MTMWRLIAPAESWKDAFPIEESEIALLEEVARRLSLRYTRDEQQRKFYLGKSESKLAWYQKTVQLSEAVAAPYETTGFYLPAPLLSLDAKEKLSPNFRAGEFFCRDSSYKFVRISPALVEALEQIRAKVGNVALTIHSAYRPSAYNASIGGVSNSAHVDGLAADISAAGVSTDVLHRAAEQVIGERGGVGYYPQQQFVHIDVRGHYSRWTG